MVLINIDGQTYLGFYIDVEGAVDIKCETNQSYNAYVFKVKVKTFETNYTEKIVVGVPGSHIADKDTGKLIAREVQDKIDKYLRFCEAELYIESLYKIFVEHVVYHYKKADLSQGGYNETV